jgi:pSer/pThr/pTyr-binding forkhead associated (FHA) protein
MPNIIVFRDEEMIMKYKIHENKQLRIGRSQENDIVISDASVSSVHAEIERDGDSFYITDFQSRNGTFVNKELVISRRLAHGDVISIGTHKLKFIYRGGEKRPVPVDSESQEATMHIDTPHHRSRLARSVAEFAEREKSSNVVGTIIIFKGNGKSVMLDKPVVTIGKSRESDIIVKGWFVANNAAEIKKKKDGYYLNPLGGKSLLVNSLPVRSEVLLAEFDMIHVGSTAMQFQFHRGASPIR